MKTIPISRGAVAMVDDEDYAMVSRFKWILLIKGGNRYAQRHSPMIRGKRTKILMHRIIMNAGKGQEIDHRDNNGLNNQKSNLRFCNRSQNNANMRIGARNTSGFKGVRFMGRDKYPNNPWRACIGFNWKIIDLGCHPTLKSAVAAYNSAAKKYFGEFAKLNAL